MHIADKNVRILKRLLNQILDFRAYENGKLDVNLVETDFGALAKDWVEAFSNVARSRDIKLFWEGVRFPAPASCSTGSAIRVSGVRRSWETLVKNISLERVVQQCCPQSRHKA